MFIITQWLTLLPMTDFYPHLPSHLVLYCTSYSYFICSFLPSVPYVFYTFPVLRTIIAVYVWLLMFTSSAFIKHLYVVTLLPSFITLCEPLFCVCIVCYVYGCVSCIMYWYQSPCHRQLSTLDAMYLQWIFTNSLLVLPWPHSQLLATLVTSSMEYRFAHWKWSNSGGGQDWKWS